MSCIAIFQLMPAEKLTGLREVWPDVFDFLQSNSQEFFSDWEFSGSCILELLYYLKDEKAINLCESDYDVLFPDAVDEGVSFLDKSLRERYEGLLVPSLFSAKEASEVLVDSFRGDAVMASKALFEGLDILRKSLEMVNEETIMVLTIVC